MECMECSSFKPRSHIFNSIQTTLQLSHSDHYSLSGNAHNKIFEKLQYIYDVGIILQLIHIAQSNTMIIIVYNVYASI